MNCIKNTDVNKDIPQYLYNASFSAISVALFSHVLP